MSDEILKKINTGLATVLSAIFPGLGQFYNGKIIKGFIFSIIGIILSFSLYLFFFAIIEPYFLVELSYDSSLVFALFYLVVWAFSIIDANKDSKKL